MPANFTSGFMVREPAWHGMGVVLDDYPENWDAARAVAGLEWEPVSAPNFGFIGANAEGETVYDPELAVTDPRTGLPHGSYTRDDDKQRVVRSDTGLLLGTPSNWYEIITHAEMGEIVEAIEGQPNVKYETTVVLDGGKAVASVVRLDEPVTLPGDNSQTLPYLALTARHDGTGALRAQSTSVRIVCANTFALAEAEGDRNNTVFTFSHSRSWHQRIEEAREAIRGLRTDFAKYVGMAEEWAKTPVTARQRELFVTEFIPMPPGELISDRVAGNVEKSREIVREILAGKTTETVNGTAYGLIQAAGEYLDWHRAYQNKSTLFGRQLLRPEKRKTRAVQIVRELVSA
jgi:phage/plasmid-like protein (TIGR03299 family)